MFVHLLCILVHFFCMFIYKFGRNTQNRETKVQLHHVSVENKNRRERKAQSAESRDRLKKEKKHHVNQEIVTAKRFHDTPF